MKFKIFVLVVVASLALVSAAFAGNKSGSTTYGYPTGENVPNSVDKGAKHKTKSAKVSSSTSKPKTKPVVVKASGALPFTGLDLMFVVAGGVLLIGTGVVLRAANR